MRVKVATTLALLVGFGLLLSFPWIVGPRPKHGAPKAAYRAYSQRITYVMGGVVGCLIGSGVGAVLILRHAREEYRLQSAKMVTELLEQTRKDIASKRAEG